MSGLHLGELNESVDVLQKENFDLKMQLFYLKQKAIDDSNNDGIIDKPSSPPSSSSNKYYNNMNDSQYASRRLSDLETELQIMKMNNLKIERELAAEKSMISTTNKSLSLSSISARALTASQIEENRSIEREAVLAIAEHDAAIINKLENEVQTLKLQHEMDIAVINECADRSNDLIRENNEKTSILIEQQEQQLRLQQQIDYLSMQFKRQELLIERTYGQKIDEITINKDINSSPMSFSWISKQNNTLVGSPGSNIAPPVISKKDIYGSPGSLLSSVKQQPMTPPSAQRMNNSMAGSTQKDFLDFGAQAAWEELHSLRKENTSLKEQLERERKLMKNQEAALNAVKQAAEEISLLEAEEISRLEAELERCTEERDKWMKNARESDNKTNLLRQRLLNLDNSRMEDETKGLSMEVEHAFYRSKSLNQSRISLNDSKSSITTLKPQIDIYKHREDMWKQREDMYKQREKELLIALEGVVLRCSELERQLFLLQKQRKHHK